jgi:hypothetical protein
MMHFSTPKPYLVFAHLAIYVQNPVNPMLNSPILDSRTIFHKVSIAQITLICRLIDTTYVESICRNEVFGQEDAITFVKETFQANNVDAHFVVCATHWHRSDVPDSVLYGPTIAARLTRVGAISETLIVGKYKGYTQIVHVF